jgi:two-component system OmpR family response regulator
MTAATEFSKILIVDDDDDILTIAKYALEMNTSLSVKTLNQSEEAIQEALKFKPDIIILDVMMPKQDGVSTLKLVRKEIVLKHIPIIFFTAKALSNEVEQFMGIGAQGIIIKPFDPLNFINEIQKIWVSSKTVSN